ncbi:MAG: hypothetical protein AAGE88_18300 [Actinomycetota bacterium]
MSLGKLFGMDQTGSTGDRTCLLTAIGHATAAGLVAAVLARAVAHVAGSV